MKFFSKYFYKFLKVNKIPRFCPSVDGVPELSPELIDFMAAAQRDVNICQQLLQLLDENWDSYQPVSKLLTAVKDFHVHSTVGENM